MAIGPGSRVGPYEITGLLGEGGMGQVYQATDTNLKRLVAIKVLPAEVAADPDRLSRFQREAEVLARLNHPNIAQIYGIERRDAHEGGPILVMEFVEGQTLADLISGPHELAKAESPKPKALPAPDALSIAKQIAAALEAAHEQGIVHRDLKPANIKVRPDGTVKVLDFGLAKAMEPAAALSQSHSVMPTITSPAMTQAGVILGTAAYMAPEQAKGRAVDARADIWAFGAVLYEMLSGRRAFDGEDMADVLSAVMRLEPDWKALPSDLPPRVTRVIQSCLRKNVKERLANVQDVRLALDGAFETEITTAATAAVAAQPVRVWQRPVVIAGIALISAAIAALADRAMTPEPERPVTRFVASTAPDGPYLGQQITNLDVAISPDGKWLIYVAGLGPTRFLYARPLDRLQGTATLGGMTGADTPFFSPDSAWVGYASQPDTSWKKVSILGGPPVTLWESTAAPRGASWSPDGTIVFGYSIAGSGLFSGPASSGTTSALTTPDATKGELNHWWPDVLPDGRSVLFTIIKGPRDQDREVALLDLETKTYGSLIAGGTSPRYVNTGHIVYGADGTLRAVPFDLSRLRVTGDPVPVVEGVTVKPTGAVNFAVSATGTLVYTRGALPGGGRRTFVWVDRKGVEEPLSAEPRDYQEFNLSPDGGRIASRVSNAEGQDIWVYDLRRNIPTRLTLDENAETFPTWTPDGNRIVFLPGGGRLSSKAANGTGAIEPIGDEGELPQAFSLDGNTLVFEPRRGGPGDIGMRALTGERASTLLLNSPFGERNAALSRDGKWIAYQSDESGTEEIYVQPFPDVNSGSRWQVSSGGGVWPVWSPVRNELYYRSAQGVMVQAYETEPTFAPRQRNLLFAFTFTGLMNNTNRRMAIAPDGQRFLLLKEAAADANAERQPPAEVVVVENWSEELKRLVPTR